MRRAAKVDANHAAIVTTLHAIGCEVLSLAALGRGCPDLLVYYRGRLHLLEVKRPAGPKGGRSQSGQRLGPLQLAFARRWPIRVVNSPDDAIEAVTTQSWPGTLKREEGQR